MIKEVDGDIVNFPDAQYIVHQCNCCSINSAHLAKAMFDKFPYANTYEKRTKDPSTRSKAGTIDIFGDGKDQRYVINLYGQYYPGVSKYENDSTEKREQWFKECLIRISKIKGMKSIAFPYGIGCGAAGGDWEKYRDYIEKVSKIMPNVDIYIVKFEKSETQEPKAEIKKIKQKPVVEVIQKSNQEDEKFKAKFKEIIALIREKVDEAKPCDEEYARVRDELKFISTNKSLVRDLCKLVDDKVQGGNVNKPNSSVFYYLGVTNVKPDITKNFRYEFSVDQENSRISPPDIDIDFERRDEILDHMCKIYGDDRVALIGTNIGYGTKAALQLSAKALNIAKSAYGENERRFSPDNDREAKRLSKIIPDGLDITLEQWLGEDEDFKMPPKFEKIAKSIKEEQQKYPKVFDAAKKLEGKIQHYSVHAAGVVVSLNPLTDDVPLTYPKKSRNKTNVNDVDENNFPITQFDMEEVEDIGLLKFDFLKIKTLNKMVLAEELIKERHGKLDFDLDNLETNDEEVLKVIDEIKVEGLFQISSNVFKGYDYHKKDFDKNEFVYKDGKPVMIHKNGLIETIGCDSFDDIVVANAIGRPGPLNLGIQNEYAKGKKDPKSIKYPHPKLKKILKPTYGCLIYQEQLIRMAQDLAGFTFAEADGLRKACGKKKKKLLEEIEPKFRQGCAINKIPENVTEAMWDIAIKFGAYAFNKSHSAAYSYITYQTAWLKRYYPTEFVCGMLSYAIGNDDKLNELIDGFKKDIKKLEIIKPNINDSKSNYVPKEDYCIIAPLSSIKGVGFKVSEEVVKKQPYLSVDDFVMKNMSIGTAIVELLVAEGCFDFFGNKEKVLTEFMRIQRIKDTATKARSKTSGVGVESLF